MEGEEGTCRCGIGEGGTFEPGEETGTFLCGPPGMVQKAALPALKGNLYSVFLLCAIVLMMSRLGVCGG